MINIFVAKLDYTISSDQLKQEFENFGRVNKATVAMDRETGKSRGFAFVEMADREEGEKAISALDGKSFNGRTIAVKEADDRGGNKRNKGAAPFKKPFEKKPGYRSDSLDKKDAPTYNRYNENENNPSVNPIENVDQASLKDTRKKSKDKPTKSYKDDSETRAKKAKSSSPKKYSKYNDFEDEDDDISLLSLRKELEREEFEDDEDDDDLDF
tara:strand:+ start:327 stop:962 length:636 start_codon:yes stop_codon:yes gene_type:complete